MTATAPAIGRTRHGWRYRIESLPIERLRGMTTAVALVATSTALHAVNLTAAPQRLTQEGDIVARAWAAANLRALGPGTYVYDHPPLGWLELGAWTGLAGGFDRGPGAVAVGRAVMLVALAVSAALLWVLARRLELPQWAAAVALALFGLSPLAISFHRMVLLENLAVPWLLAAFVLVCGPPRRLGRVAVAGACLGVAVLTSETALLVAPALALQLWRGTPAPPVPRRAALAAAGAAFAVVCGAFVAVAAARGELVPGPGRPSLIEGAWHQMFRRLATGSVLDAESVTRDIVSSWLALDPVGPLLALAAAPVALVAIPRLAPMAVGFLAVAAVVLRPGHVPPTLVVVLLPLGALLVGGVAAHLWERRAGRPVLAAAGAAVAVVAAVAWAGDGRDLLVRRPDDPLRAASAWIVDNLPAGEHVIVDDALWVDLLEAGVHPDHVTSYTALDAEHDLGADPHRAWPEHHLVVATGAFRDFPQARPRLEAAVEHSVVEVTFGTGADRVEVRRIEG